MVYIYMLPAAFLAPVIHEWVKAICSTLQGDPSPRNHGFLTLNPLRYFEPIGFLFILLFGFGWGNPTPTAALHYRDRRRGTLVTHAVPILVNLLLGMGAAVGVAVLATQVYGPMHYTNLTHVFVNFPFMVPNFYFASILMLSHFAVVNINLALFNLIPVYPMAANKLMLVFSAPETIARVSHNEKPMQVILLILLILGVVRWVLNPITVRIVAIAWGIVV